MTTEQIERINKLCECGYGKTAIANELNISINTIKSYFKRKEVRNNNLKIKKCLYCGTDVIQREHRKMKKFCSDKCRMAWWKEHRNCINKRSAKTFVCPICKKEFRSYYEQKYCSRSCYGKSREVYHGKRN